ncbi:MAG: HmuY family protein [Bacteroidales bacterium]|nr:HmuY family protein [Bacteroidales bacterium]
MKYFFLYSMLGLSLWICSACNGLFDGIYDEGSPTGNHSSSEGDTFSFSMYLDATDWAAWYYVDIHALRDTILALQEDSVSFETDQWQFPSFPVPFDLTSAWDGYSYNRTYRFRVLTGGGLSDYEVLDSTQVDTQQEPSSWDLGIHRNNVRTNRGSVLATSYTSMSSLPATSEDLLGMMLANGQDTAFTADTYNERDVWIDNKNMIAEKIPCQGIEVNEVLSTWLKINIPPIPPTFTHRANVFLLRMSDGTIAAVRLANYLSPTGVKCCLTIEIKYPY